MIGKGEKNGNIPAADTALRIAHKLGVSLESLLNMETSPNSTPSPQKLDLNLCKKYYSLIQKLDDMPDDAKKVVFQLYQGSNDIAKFKDAQEPAGGDAEYTYDLYQLTKSDAKVSRTTYQRTVTFSMNWEDAEITSVDPDSRDSSNAKGDSGSADGQ